MKVQPEHVRTMARLARIEIPEEEIGQLAPQLDAIVGYFRVLAEAGSPSPSEESAPRPAPLRPDLPLHRESGLESVAPDLRHRLVAVPRFVARSGRADD